MRNLFLALIGLILTTAVFAQSKPTTTKPATTTTKKATTTKGTTVSKTPVKSAKVVAPALQNGSDSFSYAIGANSAEYVNHMLTQQDIAGRINVDIFLSAFYDKFKRDTVRMSQEKIGLVINKVMQQINEAKSEVNRKSGEAFLAANAKKDSVVVLPSGLQYKILKAGTGAKPTTSDKVKVHYHGTLIDGTVFDSSVDRGEPLELGVTQVIKGWTEALQLMPLGSKWRLFIPSSLAYGNRDAGQKIKAGSTLIFDVELLGIEPTNK